VVAVREAATNLHTAGLADAAAVPGYTVPFRWAVGIFVLGFLLALAILPGGTVPRPPSFRTALACHTIANYHHS
jgi:hypothetical protein